MTKTRSILRSPCTLPSKDTYGNNAELYNLDRDIVHAVRSKRNGYTDVFGPKLGIKKENDTLSPQKPSHQCNSPLLPSKVTSKVPRGRRSDTTSPPMPVLKPQANISKTHILKSRAHSTIKSLCRKYPQIILPHNLSLASHVDPEIYLDKDEVKEWFAQFGDKQQQKKLVQPSMYDYLKSTMPSPTRTSTVVSSSAQHQPEPTATVKDTAVASKKFRGRPVRDYLATLPTTTTVSTTLGPTPTSAAITLPLSIKPGRRLSSSLVGTRPKPRISYAEMDAGFSDDDTEEDIIVPVVRSNRVIRDDEDMPKIENHSPSVRNSITRVIPNGVEHDSRSGTLSVTIGSFTVSTVPNAPTPSISTLPPSLITVVPEAVTALHIKNPNKRGTARKRTAAREKPRFSRLSSVDSISEVIPPKKQRVYTRPGPKPHSKVELPQEIPFDKNAQKSIFTSSLELTSSGMLTLKRPVAAEPSNPSSPAAGSLKDLLCESGKADAVYECTMCCKILDTKAQLTEHEKTHFTCKHCNKKMKNLALMKKHLNQECVSIIVRNQPLIRMERVNENKSTADIYKAAIVRQSAQEEHSDSSSDDGPAPVEEINLPSPTDDLLDECNDDAASDGYRRDPNYDVSEDGEDLLIEKRSALSKSSNKCNRVTTEQRSTKVQCKTKSLPKRRKSVSVEVATSNRVEPTVSVEKTAPMIDQSATSAESAADREKLASLFRKHTYAPEKQSTGTLTFDPTDCCIQMLPPDAIIVHNNLSDLLYYKIPFEGGIDTKFSVEFVSPKKDSNSAPQVTWQDIKTKSITAKHLTNIECISLIDDVPPTLNASSTVSVNTSPRVPPSLIPSANHVPPTSNASLTVPVNTSSRVPPPLVPSANHIAAVLATASSPKSCIAMAPKTNKSASSKAKKIANDMSKKMGQVIFKQLCNPNPPTVIQQTGQSSMLSVFPGNQANVLQQITTSPASMYNTNSVATTANNTQLVPVTRTVTLNTNIISNMKDTYMNGIPQQISNYFNNGVPLYTINTGSPAQMPIANAPQLSLSNNASQLQTASSSSQFGSVQVQNNITNIVMVQQESNVSPYLHPQRESSVVIQEILEAPAVNHANNMPSVLCEEARVLQDLIDSAIEGNKTDASNGSEASRPTEGIRVKALSELS